MVAVLQTPRLHSIINAQHHWPGRAFAGPVRCCHIDDTNAEPEYLPKAPSGLPGMTGRRSVIAAAAALSTTSLGVPEALALNARPGVIGRKVKRAAEEKAEELREQRLLSQLGTTPARFGSGRPVRAYTSESMLLSGLPVQCPPLDLLQIELEKFYVLRPPPPQLPPPSPPPSPPPLPDGDAAAAASTPPSASTSASTPAPKPPTPPPSPPSLSLPTSTPPVAADWAALEAARVEALEAAVESRPLFK